jgi:hypothetical protein
MSAHLHLPNRKRSVCEVTIAWHYTVGLKLPAIRESGVLRPTDACIESYEKPVCWFSVNPYWEPTSAKISHQSFIAAVTSEDRAAFRRFMQETAEVGEGLYRFGMPTSGLIRWPEIGKRANIKAFMRNALMRSGRAQGAEPSQWYGTLHEVPIEGLIFQQLVDFRYWATKEKLLHREQQLVAIAGMEIHVSMIPFSELRQLAHDDTGRVNHIRHRLTIYHRLLEKYDAGDAAILRAIRVKVYGAIAVAYPELAPECRRQLEERL